MATIGFEEKLWASADKLRNNMDAAEYKHVVLGLIFLKYVSDTFMEKHKELMEEDEEFAEDIDAYMAEGVFWVPENARWDYIAKHSKQAEIGQIVDNALDLIEKDNDSLRGVLPKNYSRSELDKRILGEIIDLFTNINVGGSIGKEKDVLGRVYEYFLGKFAANEGKGGGEFYTPKSIVKLMVEMIEPFKGYVYDPACGSGGFLVESLRYVWNKLEEKTTELGWPEAEIEAEKQKVAIKNFRGIDKDNFLSKVAKAYLAILGDGRGGVHCENSLDKFTNWSAKTKEDIVEGTFDVIVTNPPFGKKLSIDATEILELYDLGHKWKQDGDGNFVMEGLVDKQPPQILFIERCFQMLKPGGRMGIVLLESIFGMPKYQYVVDYIRRKSKILAVVTLPEDLFQPNTHAKCCVLICQKYKEDESFESCGDYNIFMSDVKWCGHDSRGNVTYRYLENGEKTVLDEIPLVAERYKEMKQEDAQL